MCIGLALAMVGGDLNAQSLREARTRDAQEEALSKEAAFTRSVCGSNLTASIDWSSALIWPQEQSLVAACDGALSAIEAICRRGDKDKANTITRFVCAADGTGPSLSSGTLRYGARVGENSFESTRRFLDGAL